MRVPKRGFPVLEKAVEKIVLKVMRRKRDGGSFITPMCTGRNRGLK